MKSVGVFSKLCFCVWLTWFLEFKFVDSRVVQAAAGEKRSGIACREMNCIGSECSKDDVLVFQGQMAPLPDGVPAYSVQILNSGASGCRISHIHVKCGWFSSARLVNPRVFKRLDYDDCLINNGKAIGPGQSLSFHYANTFPYPLSVSSVTCSS